jgi:hypothetical protein
MAIALKIGVKIRLFGLNRLKKKRFSQKSSSQSQIVIFVVDSLDSGCKMQPRFREQHTTH